MRLLLRLELQQRMVGDFDDNECLPMDIAVPPRQEFLCCTACDGRGYHISTMSNIGRIPVRIQCPVCGGKGFVVNE